MEMRFNKVSYISNKKTVINNVNVILKEGKVNCFIGPNGSGKSILLHLLNGQVLPTKGIIGLGDFEIGDKKLSNKLDSVYLNISSIGQYPEEHFFCESVYKELVYWLESYNYKKEKMNKHIKDAIKMVGLSDDYLSYDPLNLSSSEMRKVLLAKCLAVNPKVLILDEPTIGLDNADKSNLIRILKTIKRRFHKTIVIVSQDIEFVHQVSDYLFAFDNGKLLIEGDKYEVFGHDELLTKHGIIIPKIIQFELLVKKEKNIKLGLRDETNDLIKDILRNT